MDSSRRLPQLRRLAILARVLAVALFFMPWQFAHRPAHAQEMPTVEAQELAAISPHLENELASTEGSASFLVILDDQVDAQGVVSETVASAGAEGADRVQRAEALYRTMVARAEAAQAPLRSWLEERHVPYRAFHIVNMIEVRGDAALAQALRRAPGVDRLAANPLVRGQAPVVTEPAAAWLMPLPVQGSQSTVPWHPGLYGLPYTQAPEVWDLGYTGHGIVVASQDTGVQWDHPALVERYRGWDAASGRATHPYNWFDAWDMPSAVDRCGPDYQVPCDDNGHGTHTVGTMVGDATGDPASGLTHLGMAPDAQWIGCRNMRNNFGTPASYAACFEFFLAPYPQGGDPFTDGRPELAPHVINNSWTCPPFEGCDANSLRQVVETVRAAGQLVVASAGNSGPLCSTVQSPISLHDATFTIGAHDSSGMIASFSSRGPVTADGSNRLKPDIAAPGVSVLSAVPRDGYGLKSGTSMSAPHVAGAAALIWSAAPDLIGDVDLTEQVLLKSATPVSDSECTYGAAASPNPVYGYGRLNALEAVILARTPWRVTVQVVDEAGAPHVNLPVELVDNRTQYRYAATSNANGVSVLSPVLSGTYTLRIGRGNDVQLEPGINLGPADDPDAGVRLRRINVTYSVPTALDDDPEFPLPGVVYLPLVGQ